MLLRFRHLIYIHASTISFVLELLIVVIALIKISVLSTNQVETDKALLELSKNQIYAVEGIRRYLTLDDKNQLNDTYNRLKQSSQIVLTFIGRNQPICILDNGIRFEMTFGGKSAITELVNQDLASTTRQANGRPCNNSLEDPGKLSQMFSLNAISEYTEWILVLFGVLLFWTKLEQHHFDSKFPVRRQNEKNIPYYLR